MIFFYFVLILILELASATSGHNDDLRTLNPGPGNEGNVRPQYFWDSTSNYTIYGAIRACSKEGYHLPIISNNWELQRLAEVVNERVFNFWTDGYLHGVWHVDNFEWSDRTPIPKELWRDFQPTGSGSNADCVYMYKSDLGSLPCTDLLNLFCILDGLAIKDLDDYPISEI